MEKIAKSVGRNGQNLYQDVSVVQTLINGCVHLLGPFCILDVDGRSGDKTAVLIEQFQSSILKIKEPDGRVDPGGRTLRSLNERSAVPVKAPPAPGFTDLFSLLGGAQVNAGYHFPIKNRPTESYKSGMRRFGSKRKKGRLHAGCDIYAPVGTNIYALDDGIVETPKYSFYLGTFAIEIKHKNFVARYGEVGSVVNSLSKGASVKRGQLIGTVGELRGLNMSMLHLELYSGKSSGALTNRGNKPYQRRSDLMDPTPILDEAK